MSENSKERILEVRDLKVHFPVQKGVLFKTRIGDVKAVDGINFHADRGETVGLVGESGCGKSTTGLAILRMTPVTGGEIIFEGESIANHSKAEMRSVRRRMQMIYQDPFGSLNPRMTVATIIGEPLVVHDMAGSRRQYDDRISELLEIVGLNPAMRSRYPHEFSGGQRQRIGIARALAVNPDFIVCDEPVSALDVSIQAQVINILEELQERLDLTYLFIAHDLAVVRHISDRIIVMYLGKIVESADRLDLYHRPQHPYTKALLAAVPIPNPKAEAEREHIFLEGEVPSPLNPPSGCHFHPRCPFAMDRCKTEEPQIKDFAPGHAVACHLLDQ
jgi:oligopeptide transport system ATP-binding protein